MSEQYEDIEHDISLHYQSMLDYKELKEPDMASLHEYKMNQALQQWSDLHHYLGKHALVHEL